MLSRFGACALSAGAGARLRYKVLYINFRHRGTFFIGGAFARLWVRCANGLRTVRLSFHRNTCILLFIIFVLKGDLIHKSDMLGAGTFTAQMAQVRAQSCPARLGGEPANCGPWPAVRRYSAPGAPWELPGFYSDVGGDWGAPALLPPPSLPPRTAAQWALACNGGPMAGFGACLASFWAASLRSTKQYRAIR